MNKKLHKNPDSVKKISTELLLIKRFNFPHTQTPKNKENSFFVPVINFLFLRHFIEIFLVQNKL